MWKLRDKYAYLAQGRCEIVKAFLEYLNSGASRETNHLRCFCLHNPENINYTGAYVILERSTSTINAPRLVNNAFGATQRRLVSGMMTVDTQTSKAVRDDVTVQDILFGGI